MANDGSTKAKAIKEADTSVTKTASKVTGLYIARSGNVFTAYWQNTATYSKIKVRTNLYYSSHGGWQGWSDYTTLPITSSTSYQIPTINFGTYFPNSGYKLEYIKIQVAVDQANESQVVYQHEKHKGDSKKKWYYHNKITKYSMASEYATFWISVPYQPTLTSADGSSTTSFTLTAPASNSADTAYVATSVVWQTAVVQNWGTQSAGYFAGWGNWEHEETSATGQFNTDNWTFTRAFGASSITRDQSFSVLALGLVRGVAGDSYYNYAPTVVYAYPYSASGITATNINTISSGTAYSVTLAWNRIEDSLHPAEKFKIQYYIGEPKNASLEIPSGISWKDGTGYEDARSGTAQATTFYTDTVIGEEQCLWVRVIQMHVQNLETPSDVVLLGSFVAPTTPEITNVAYDAVSHALSVTVNEKSELDGVTTKVYVGNSTFTVPANGIVSTTYELPLGESTIRARNEYGSKASEYHSVTFDPAKDANNPLPYAPTNVKVEKSDVAGNVIVSWVPILKDDDISRLSSRITVANNANEWTKANPSFVKDITVEGNAKSAIVGSLTLDRTYYFKVQSTNSHGTTNYSTDTASIFLKSNQPPVPNITGNCIETADHDIKVTWNWDLWEDARQLQLTWSTNKNDGMSNRLSPTVIEKDVSNGTQSFYISSEDLERGETWYIWARFVADEAVSRAGMGQVTMTLTPTKATELVLAREAQITDEEGKSTVRLTWKNNWKDAEKTEISWAMSNSAWDSTEGVQTYELDKNETTKLINGLELGKTWYARVKSIYNDKYSALSSIASIDLRTVPKKPQADVVKTVVSKSSKIDAYWTYVNEDLSEQKSATVVIYDDENAVVRRIGVSSSEKAISIDAKGFSEGTRYHFTVTVVSNNGKKSEESNPVYFRVVDIPTASITSTSLVNGELKSLPLTVTVSGAPTNGSIAVYIERSTTILLARPDEATSFGYKGELVAVKEGSNSGTLTISQSDLHTDFTEDGEYTITAYAINELGEKSKPKTLNFRVKWTHQALMPIVAYEIDPEHYIAKITVTAPSGTAQTDTFDIYRLSADKPELILRGGTWGVTYVDPYPALGENTGHRVVFRTINGDYTTASGRLAWADCIPPNGTEEPFLGSDTAIIDFGNEQVELEYNLNVSHSFEKDFAETKYLGGSIQGDWNPAVSCKTSIGGLMIRMIEAGDIIKMRRLAAYTGICHVRTPDGSSFPADIQVSESWSSEKQFGFADYTLDITRVDSESLDCLPLAEWEDNNGLE